MAIEIELVVSENKVTATVFCSSVEDEVTHKLINTVFSESEFSNAFYDESQVQVLIDSVAAFLDMAATDDDCVGKSFSGGIATLKPAEAKVTKSEDNMSATIKVIAAYGGKILKVKDVIKLGQEQNITFGYDNEAIKLLVIEAKNAAGGEVITGIIAKGKPPENGKHAYLEYFVQSAEDRILKPQKIDGNRVDMRDLGAIESIGEGEKLACKHPATAGKAGVSILGDAIEPIEGTDFELVIGEGTSRSTENPHELLATRSGLPKKIENGMMVDKVFQSTAVDVSTGHINFDGAIIINGDVSQGMKVTATGDIHINGMVESASIKAGGSVIIDNGAVGKQTDIEEVAEPSFSTVIEAAHSINLKHGQYIDLIAGNDINIERHLLHSRTNANFLTVGGKLVGGRCNLAKGVEAGTIGAPAGSSISITVNRHYDWLLHQQVVLREKIEFHKLVLFNVKTAMQHLSEELVSSADKTILLKDSLEAFNHHKDLCKRYTRKFRELKNKKKSLLNILSVQANSTLHSGVHVHIAEEAVLSNKDYGKVNVAIRKGRIGIK